VHTNLVGLRATVGRGLGLLGIVCAAVGILLVNGISIEFPGIMLGGLGYYFGLTAGDEAGQAIGIAAAVLCAVCMAVSGLEYPLQ
jgi:hypothetical protein